ncbi:TMEM175 family protein [Ferruginibacter profundus]
MNHEPLHEERLKFQLDRIALFSDAVFAIAITLLVIEIKVPALPHDKDGFNSGFGHAMGEMLPEFIGFIISFIVVGNYWRVHHTMFGFVTDYNRKLLNINGWFLFTIVCMPFTTAFMSKYIFFQPYLIYCINVMAAGLIQVWLWVYIARKKNKVSSEIPGPLYRYKIVSSLVVVGCFFVSFIVHRLLGSFTARIFLLSIFIIETFVTLHYRKKYQLSKKY